MLSWLKTSTMSSTFFKKYRVTQQIGEGSFSEVLKCQNKETNQYFAAKQLKKIYQNTNEVFESPEVIAMRKISRHPNILYMIETHYDPLSGKVILLFELMDMSLYDLIQGRKGRLLSEQKVKVYLYQLLKGLEHLHKHGVFHRDIKPENVLLKVAHSIIGMIIIKTCEYFATDKKGDIVKLADLGSIRGIYSRPPYTEYISTRWYRSPECLLTTGFYGPKMDVWATGCVFYELLTLKPLFPGSDEVDQIAKIHSILGTPHARLMAKFRRHNKIRNCEYFFPTKSGSGIGNLIPQVTESGKDILRLMLVYDPENRSNAKGLLEHRYFDDLREIDTSKRLNSVTFSNSLHDSCNWRNPVLLSYMTSERRRKSKLPIHHNKAGEEKSLKIPRIVSSSPKPHPRTTNRNTRVSKLTKFHKSGDLPAFTDDKSERSEKSSIEGYSNYKIMKKDTNGNNHMPEISVPSNTKLNRLKRSNEIYAPKEILFPSLLPNQSVDIKSRPRYCFERTYCLKNDLKPKNEMNYLPNKQFSSSLPQIIPQKSQPDLSATEVNPTTSKRSFNEINRNHKKTCEKEKLATIFEKPNLRCSRKLRSSMKLKSPITTSPVKKIPKRECRSTNAFLTLCGNFEDKTPKKIRKIPNKQIFRNV